MLQGSYSICLYVVVLFILYCNIITYRVVDGKTYFSLVEFFALLIRSDPEVDVEFTGNFSGHNIHYKNKDYFIPIDSESRIIHDGVAYIDTKYYFSYN